MCDLTLIMTVHFCPEFLTAYLPVSGCCGLSVLRSYGVFCLQSLWCYDNLSHINSTESISQLIVHSSIMAASRAPPTELASARRAGGRAVVGEESSIVLIPLLDPPPSRLRRPVYTDTTMVATDYRGWRCGRG